MFNVKEAISEITSIFEEKIVLKGISITMEYIGFSNNDITDCNYLVKTDMKRL